MALSKIMPKVASDLERSSEECFLEKKDTYKGSNCIGSPNPRVLLLGDSHAGSLFPGLKGTLEKHGVELGMLGAAYCLPLVEKFRKNPSKVATPRCERINAEIRNALRSNDFDVILVSTHMLQWQLPDSEWSYGGYYEEFMRELKQISGRAKVAVIGQFPVWKPSLPASILKTKVDRIEDLDQFSAEDLDERVFSFDTTYGSDVRRLSVRYLSVVDLMCKNQQCMRYISRPCGAQLVTFDYGHLALESSTFVAEKLVAPAVLELLRQGGAAPE